LKLHSDPSASTGKNSYFINQESLEHQMGLDIRIPLGLIFLFIGGLMSVYGLITRNSAAIYEKSMGINLNLTWGLIMFLFGLAMYLVGRRQKWQDDPVNPRPWEKSAGPRH
jgi:hypothetical protein